MYSAELISIGTELLNGATVNTNAAFISRKLKAAGFVIQRQTSIPDEKEIIIETLSESLACASLVIATGGLGPTVDDLTREAVAELMDTPLEFNEGLAEILLKRYGEIPSLQNQATVPKLALLLPNTSGTAVGLVFIKGQSILIVLPGVPLEMESMMEKEVLPYLKRLFPSSSSDETEVLHFFSLYESTVDPTLRKLQLQFPELQMGIYPHNGLLSVSLQGKEREVAHSKEALLMEFGKTHYESSDGKIETAIQELFVKQKWTLSIAESCTGGAAAARLTSISGASKYFLGSLVLYANALKEKILGISPQTIKQNGAVSEETSLALAVAVQEKTNSTFAIGITGIAGPSGGSKEKPVGTTFIAFKKENGAPFSLQISAKGERALIIDRTVNISLGELYRFAKSLTES